MKTLIVTGGIGSGKSLLCRELERRGVRVYDCDRSAKALYESDAELLSAVLQKFPSTRREDGTLDRGKLAGEIFGDDGKRRELEAIVHPAVMRDFRRWALSQGNVPYVVMETALYFSMEKTLRPEGKVLLVDAPESLRLDRACARDGVRREEMLERMRSQVIDYDAADAVVINDSDPESFLQRAAVIIDKLINE